MKGYIESNIYDDEEIIYRARVSIIPLIIYVIPVILFVILTSIVNNIWFSVLAVFVMILCIIGLIRAIISISAIELAITDRRIIGKRGFINIRVLEAPLNKVTAVSIKKGLLGHIFNYGHINIDVFSCKYEYGFIQKPEVFKQELMKLI